jgi:hypothetical protein
MGAQDLWEELISDSEYLEKSGVLQQQHEDHIIQQNDIHDNETYPSYNNNNKKIYKPHYVIKWINIVDKGYCINESAWKAG